jgi:hypothetical protein
MRTLIMRSWRYLPVLALFCGPLACGGGNGSSDKLPPAVGDDAGSGDGDHGGDGDGDAGGGDGDGDAGVGDGDGGTGSNDKELPGPGCVEHPKKSVDFLNQCVAPGIQWTTFDNATRLPASYTKSGLPPISG